MEQFNEPYKKVREKSVYLLHLDTVRIILIVLAVAGIVVASFLLGMNYIKSDNAPTTSITENDPLLSRPSGLSLTNPEIPEMPNGEDKGNKTLEPEKENAFTSDSKENQAEPQVATKEKEKGPGKEIAEHAPVIVLPHKHTEKAHRHEKVAVTHKGEREVARQTRTKRGNRERREKEKNRVVEVSSHTAPERERNEKGFSIQIASYDTKAKATAEAERLKQSNYDSYIDKATINGKRFYRVRVGPLTSHSSAEKILQELQESERYSESFMVHE